MRELRKKSVCLTGEGVLVPKTGKGRRLVDGSKGAGDGAKHVE